MKALGWIIWAAQAVSPLKSGASILPSSSATVLALLSLLLVLLLHSLFCRDHLMTQSLEATTVEALDKLVERVYQTEGLNLTRMDLIRQAIRQYIARLLAALSYS